MDITATVHGSTAAAIGAARNGKKTNMTTDPQPIEMPEAFDWYWPSDLNDEWIVWGRNPRARSRGLAKPSDYKDAYGPVLARRKPWTPKKGDRVLWKTVGPAVVLNVDDDGNWFEITPTDADVYHVLAGDLAPLPEADQ